MCPTDQTTTSATTARPRTTLWAAELKRARIDFVMLSPSLARLGKVRPLASGGQAPFQDDPQIWHRPRHGAHARLRLYRGEASRRRRAPRVHAPPYRRSFGNRSQACGLVAVAGNEHSCPAGRSEMSA